jgi:hypothetical protein
MNMRVGVRQKDPHRGSNSLKSLKNAVSAASRRTYYRETECAARVTVRQIKREGL